MHALHLTTSIDERGWKGLSTKLARHSGIQLAKLEQIISTWFKTTNYTNIALNISEFPYVSRSMHAATCQTKHGQIKSMQMTGLTRHNDDHVNLCDLLHAITTLIPAPSHLGKDCTQCNMLHMSCILTMHVLFKAS